MRYLTKELADTLCTIIATGYMLKYPKTKFVYENDKDQNDHDKLKVLLDKCHVHVEFEKATPQDVQPLIFGKTGYLYDQAVINGITDDYKAAIDYLQKSFKAYKEEKKAIMPGAYIGSKVDLSRFLFDGPSALNLYDPKYREVKDDSVKESYENAKKTNNFLVDFLENVNVCPLKTGGRNLVPDRTNFNKYRTKDDYQPHKLFSSCHGMILALYDYGIYLQKSEVCVELALGPDTSKVASCLPCSLFMAANHYPATATHLGRGDNWYYHPEMGMHTFTSKWKTAVGEIYQTGLTKFPLSGDNKASRFTAYLTDRDRKGYTIDPVKEIPDIFLEALTFEDSFIKRMLWTLQLQ